MGILDQESIRQAIDSGEAEPNARRYVYKSGTDELAPLFQDSELTLSLANPMRADQAGMFDNCYVLDGEYRVEIRGRGRRLLTILENLTVLAWQNQGAPYTFEDVGLLLNDKSFSYQARWGNIRVPAGAVMKTASESFTFRVASEDAEDAHVETAGGLKLYVLPDSAGARNVRAFGVKGDGVANDGPALQRAFTVGGRVIVQGICMSNQPLVIERTTTHLACPTFQLDRIKVGPSFPQGETLLTVKSVGRRQGGDFNESPFIVKKERYFSAENLTLDGDQRGRRAHGLYLAEQVDDLTIRNLAVHDFKGAGVRCGAIEQSDVQDEFRESLFDWVHVKNCGHCVDGNDFAAFEMNVNSASDFTGAINNIQLSKLKIVYPRGVGLRFKSDAPSSVSITRAIFIDDLFMHGNRSLAGAIDNPNSEPWASGSDLIEIGHAGATDTQIVVVTIGNLNLVESENSQTGVRVYDGSKVNIGQAYITAAAGRYGLRLSGAGNCTLGQFLTRQTGVATQDTLQDLIKIDSLQDGCRLHVGTILGGTLAQPNYDGDIRLLQDDGRVVARFDRSADTGVGNTSSAVTFGGFSTGVQYINKITLVPFGNVASNDTNFATLTLQRRELGVVTQNVSVFNSKSTGSGATGNWVNGAPIDIPVTAQKRLDPNMLLQLSVTKTGSGVSLPKFFLLVEMSTNVAVI